MKRLTPSDVLARLRTNTVEDADTGCWMWQGSVRKPKGYATWAILGEQLAHRAAYVALNGTIPPGLQIDHTCHNRDVSCKGGAACAHRRCVNPDHLEAVPSRTNILRSLNTIAGINSRRTECKWGHPFDEDNTLTGVTPKGTPRRWCRACSTRRRRASTQGRRFAVPATDAA